MLREKPCRTLMTIWMGVLCVGSMTGYASSQQPGVDGTDQKGDIEEIFVWGTRNPLSGKGSSPSRKITRSDVVSINTTTTEDLVKYEPGVVIRKRFIGDANGTMGIRGANMFQTTRSMVFADGVPLHYFLQTRWNGSPRWSLVSADEIAEIDITYGPFSALYGGNAMGGVINIETAIPTERKIHAEISTFQQDFESLGFSDDLPGYKGFVSFADKFGDVSVYASLNRLVNEGQPMTFFLSADDDVPAGTQATPVLRGEVNTNEYRQSALIYGNNGVTEVTADQIKVKLGYETDNWLTIVNLAFEDRSSENRTVENYLRDANGNPVWNGWVVQNGLSLEVENDDFAFGKSERHSLLIGGRTRGQLNRRWHLEVGASRFVISKDETYSTNAGLLDPAFTPGFQLTTDYGDTGWWTLDLKLLNENLLDVAGLELAIGYHYDHYELEIEGSSGGKSQTRAAFVQLNYRIDDTWGVDIGGRYEAWDSRNGFFVSGGATQLHPDRSENHFSPKLAVRFEPLDWRLIYSVAKAFRFPIVEELFQNERTARSRSVANASLGPEQGLHHNIEISRSLGNGNISVNLFSENIDDVIFSQTGTVGGTSLRTFLPVTEVTTHGADFTVQQYNLFNTNIDMRFNLSYLDSEITRNDPNRALEGNEFPRMPEWRSNLLLTWHVNGRWDVGGGIRYASDSFGDLDNGDTAGNVFGAHDEFTFVNFKTSYRFNKNLKLALGVDNVTNEIAYVHHPWPGRTLFLEVELDY